MNDSAGPLFSLKPVFIGWTTLLAQLPFQLFFTVWSGGFFGGFAITMGGVRTQMSYVIFGAIAFFGVPLWVYFNKSLNYTRTEYRFFADRLEFEEGFFNINRKVIKFRDVKEVTLRKGILQRVNNLGTIYLATLATGTSQSSNPFSALGFGSASASGISVRDIANPDEAYERIKQLVDAPGV